MVTAGPTREHLDDVRFLSNGSTGRMGFAIAIAAQAAGHRVQLVSGPTELPDPPGVEAVRVVSALEMAAAVDERFPDVDVMFGVAAVADARPAVRLAGKGIDKAFGFLGATLALAGCVAGNLLTGCWYLAQSVGAEFVDVLAGLTPTLAAEILKATFSPMDLLFYGFAVYEGYRLSFRQVTEEDLKDPFEG